VQQEHEDAEEVPVEHHAVHRHGGGLETGNFGSRGEEEKLKWAECFDEVRGRSLKNEVCLRSFNGDFGRSFNEVCGRSLNNGVCLRSLNFSMWVELQQCLGGAPTECLWAELQQYEGGAPTEFVVGVGVSTDCVGGASI